MNRTHAAFELTANALEITGSTGTALWVIERVPLYFTLTLIEMFVVDGGPSISLALRSDLESEDAPWNEIGAYGGSSPVRLQIDHRVTAPCRRLVVRGTVDSASTNTIARARITLVDDHF